MQQQKGHLCAPIADYDSDDYDYRSHWQHRDYEQWAESRVLQHIFQDIEEVSWLIDLGGGFGRNAVHYFQHTTLAVVVDYSLENLKRAATMYEEEVRSERLFLLRADLYHLPFIDGAFDMGLTVRVLHHLPHIEAAIKEMGRVISHRWLLDVPIKHHALACIRGIVRGKFNELFSSEPKMLGSDETPFANYSLMHVRRLLATYGWENQVVASVNNFRRWDQHLPQWCIACLRPLVYGLEMLMQWAGRGWWGPSQFVQATRRKEMKEQSFFAQDDAPLIALKVVCPTCHKSLQWFSHAAYCRKCSCSYLQIEGVWDFVSAQNMKLFN